ncbi:uncharacterized protein LOC103099164 isoform X1 [Monodelphis domestica]|uniref:uncharacterized protein LOC103099164 isoform X1 n=1 Tax=Monodelphis domestica TaxID=13616 RepID=UPI0024E2689C|nr:uncharacterized protein LOC103099164 isoform X1 [Monodelphis domestica]
MELVFELRGLSADSLMDLWRRSSFKCRDNWQPLVDALPSCGTEACIALMKELIMSGDVENDEAESFLWSLAFVPQPTSGMVHLLLPLLQSPGVSSSAFLTISALVHNLCMAGGVCERLPGVSSFMQILREALGESCSSQGSKDIGWLQLVLKAIGNAGLAAAPLASVLSSCAVSKNNAPEIRLAAIQAFRRIPCSVNHSGLAQLYQATEEDAEIRTTAYYFLMKCPSEETFALVRETQAAEKSSQVGAFVWSHLSELLETDDPLKRSLRDSIPDDVLSQEFEVETWKHSSYSDVTFHSASSSMGANLEATLLFSPASFLPQSIMANLTIHVMGRAVNIMELGLRVENAEKLASRWFGRQQAMTAFWNNEEKGETRPDTDMDPAFGVNEMKSGAGCPGGRHSKMKELQEKVTQRWGKRRDLRCGLSLKIFGNELSFVDCGAVRSHMKRYSLNLAELTVKLLKGQEVQINRRLSLATEELSFPTVSGLPVQVALNASAAINIRIRGTVDLKQLSDFSVEGYIKPSALIQIAAHMGVAGFLGKSGMKWVTGIRSSTSLDGGITVKRGQELKMFLNTPEESMEVVNFSSKLYLMNLDGVMTADQLNSPSETQSCTGEEASHLWGWQLCSRVSYPAWDQPFSLAVPIEAAVTLKKQDKGLRQYLLEAAYTFIPQKDSWIPEEATIHFFMGTPKSERPRDVGVDLSFSVPQKKLRIKLLHPKKKIKVDGKIDSLQSTRFGHLEMILDDKDVYYIKGLSDVQTSRGEQRYETQLEAKLIRRGSPVILMGNITKQMGRKMTFSMSLMNVLKDKAFLSAILEKKAEDGFQLYALEGEVYLPDIVGFHAIGLLQQRGSLWTNALRIKYGLLGEAKHLQQECNAGQKLKVENHLEVYKLDLGHEFHCTQVTTYNHKIQLQHEESVSRLHSMLEVSYGKHWDEINNQRKLRVSQTFKNDSGPALSNYFMEFLLQIPERQVDYRTQLQHSSFSQGHVESSTHLKVQYNGRLPFVAGLQWKDTSRGLLWKWEGALNLDTPWLLLSLAHRLHQPHRAMYQATWELTAGKALSIRNLVVELSCKDKVRDKEGKIRIYTPTTTYLRASTSITWDQSILRSQGELVTTWSPLVQIKAHLENRWDKKLFHCWLKGPRQGLNLTSAYRYTERPRKTTVLIMALWTDSKSQPIGLQLDGQLEELKRERLLYQKRGTLHLRHPLKLPIPQSLLLQETFTADKSQKHYMLETKVLVNELEECLQTLTLGYQADRPYICATLTHPYNSKVIPRSIDTCVVTRIQQNRDQEVEAALKVDQKDVLYVKGRHHNGSLEGDFHHGLNLDLTHSTQLSIPQTLGLSGEIFFKQRPLGEFDCGVTLQASVSQKVTSQFLLQLNGSKSHFAVFSHLSHPARVTFLPNFQVQAAGRHYKDGGINGSLSVHASGKELTVLEASMSRETRKSSKGWDVSAIFRQAIFTEPRAVRLQLSSKITPARVWFFSKMNLNQNSVQMFLTGSKEQKVGPILSLKGRVQHNIDNWGALPKLLDLTGSLKQKNHSNEGNLSILIEDAMFGLRLRDKHMMGNSSSTHSVTAVMVQNGSRAIPGELKLRGQLESQADGFRGHATFHADKTVLSLGTACITAPPHRQLSAHLAHNSSTLRNAGLPTHGEILFSHTSLAPGHRLTLGLQSPSGGMEAAFRVEGPSGEFPESRVTANLSHTVAGFRQLGIPFSVEGDCYYQNSGSRLVASMKAGLDGEHFRMALERKKNGSSSEEMVLGLEHSVTRLLGVVPSRLQVSCGGETSSSQLSGHCSGDISRHPFESPAMMSLNGSLLADGCKASLVGHLSSGEDFTHIYFHTFCGLHSHLEAGLQHSWPLLKGLGIARENQIRVSATRGDSPRALLQLTTGPCSVMADGGVRKENNTTHTNWTLSLGNHCPILEKAGFPQSLATRGSLRVGACSSDLTMALQSDGGDAHMHLASSCRQKSMVQGSLQHSFQSLSRLGLPPSSTIQLQAGLDPDPQSSLTLQVGQCQLRGSMELQPGNKTQWVLETETDCELLQELGIPAQIRVNGSAQGGSCQTKLLCTLMTKGGQAAYLELRGTCQPQLTIRAALRHNLPALWAVPEETKLSLQAGKQAKYQLGLELRSGTCELQANGDLQLEKRFQWRVLAENSCQAMQALGAPGRIDGSGYVVVNSVDLDAQMLVTVDDSTIRGLLILKATETHQELDMLFTHNLPDSVHFGIPARTLVDVTTVRNNHSYKRTIRCGMDSKQISEELSFTQQSDYVSLDYKIRQNVPMLQALGVEDRIELQVSLDHQAAKNLSGRAQYGSGIITFGGHSQSSMARQSWSGALWHNWPVLLQCGLPDSLQFVMDLRGAGPNVNSSVNILAGRTSLHYTVSCSYTGQQMAISCWSKHNSTALRLGTGYPEVAGLTVELQTLETKTQGSVNIQGGDRKVSLDAVALTAVELNGTLELVTHLRHTVPILRQLGLPFTTQLVFQEILAAREMKASLEVTCESQTSLLIHVRGRNQPFSKELHITCQQHLSFLLHHFPGRAKFSTKVNYSTDKAESMVAVDLEKHHFHAATKLTFAASNLTQVTELMHTIPQLKIIPWEMVLLTVYQKAKGTRTFQQLVLWDGQEVKFTGSYTGLFPKFSRGQHMQLELVHPLSIPFPQHSKVTMSLLHSVHSHQDNLVIEWNNKEQVVLSSSLKLGKDQMDGQVAFVHPFNFSWSHVEARGLAEKRGNRYSQQVLLAWNRGKPANFQLIWADKSEVSITSWEGCLTATLGQLQEFLSPGHVQACGAVTQTAGLFSEHLDLSWDSQKVKQSLKYERSQSLQSDRLHVEMTLENIFLTSCPKQNFLGEIETNYLSRLSHSLKLGLCDLPSAVMVSGEHLLSQGSFMLQSRSLIRLAPDPGDGLVLALTLRNQSTPKTQNFSGELELRGPGDQQVSLLGRVTESAAHRAVLLQGSMEGEEKLELTASRAPDCLRASLAYGKGTKEEAVEIRACSDGRQVAKAEALLHGGGGHGERLGQLILRAANQSLSLEAHGCITPIGNMESKLAEVGSRLQARLVEKFQVFDAYIQKFRDLVRRIDFLDTAAGWVLQMSQAAGRALQAGGKAAAGLWRQSSARQVLRHHLSLHLERLQSIMEQTQSELQKPLATLKAAYYEVTLQPLDEVWRERTEEALRRIQACVPAGMKDTWLTRPVLLSLQAVKGALDLAAHQILKWAEAKFSKAVRRIRRPLASIYSFSARNCSVLVRLPVLPGGDQPLNVARVANYLVEEKLLQPLRELYGVNLLAEYYGIKHRLLENPFEHHAVMIGDRHVVTFDGHVYDLTSKCSLVLAKDFAHNSFLFLLNQSSTGPKSLYVELNNTAFIIYPGPKGYNVYESSLKGENCLSLDPLPLPAKVRVNGRKEIHRIELSNENGAVVSCDLHSDLCSMTLDGWNHGLSAGILGTNDNEAGNDLLLPNGSLAGNLEEFAEAWQVDGECRTQRKKEEVCLRASSSRLCKAFFLDAHSELRNCFRVVDPAPFYRMCARDLCETSELRAACTMVSAYIHLCGRGFVPLGTPPPCF